MRRRVAWVFVGMNLALWLGGCAADERAYRINEEQTPLFEEGPPTQESPAGPAAPLASLEGFDRSNWETYHYQPARGLVPHRPHYFTREFFWREPLHRDRGGPLRADGDIEATADAVTGNSREPMGWRRFFDSSLESADFFGDLIYLPVRATFVERPWDVVYSPQE